MQVGVRFKLEGSCLQVAATFLKWVVRFEGMGVFAACFPMGNTTSIGFITTRQFEILWLFFRRHRSLAVC